MLFRSDLVMIDMNTINNMPCESYESALTYSAKTEDVLMTMVDGDILYNKGEYTTIDKERLMYTFRDIAAHYYE